MHDLRWMVLSNVLLASLLGVLAAVVRRLRPTRPAWAHALWLLALIKLITPPLVPVALPRLGWPSQASVAQTPAVLDQATTEKSIPIPMVLDPWLPGHSEVTWDLDPTRFEEDRALARAVAERPASSAHPPAPVGFLPGFGELVLAVLVLGALWVWILAGIRLLRFERFLRREAWPAGSELKVNCSELALLIGIDSPPPVLMVPGSVPLLLWSGWGSARLVAPCGLFTDLDGVQQAGLLLHELAHYKRRDHWVRWLELFVCGLYWWNPAAWWIRRGLRAAEEECCDAWVVSGLPQGSRFYANALLLALDFASRRPRLEVASALGGGGDSLLRRRFQMIMHAHSATRLDWSGRAAVIGLALLGLPLAPVWAGQDGARPTQPSGESRPLERPRPDDQMPDATDRFRDRVNSLLDRLREESQPLQEEMRKAFLRSLDHVRSTLNRSEGFSADALREAAERAGEELRRSFESGGPIDREAREAWERATRDAREEWNRAVGELRKSLDEMRERGLREDRSSSDRAVDPDLERELDMTRKRLEKLQGETRELQAQLHRHEAEARAAALHLRQLERRARQRRMELEVQKRSEQQGVAPGESKPKSPAEANVRLGGAPTNQRGADLRSPAETRLRGARAEESRRLRELEAKMDLLMKELKELREQRASSRD